MNRSNERFVGFVGAIVKVLAIARKTLLELLRGRMTAVLTLFFPVAVVVFYYVAFEETDQGLAKYLTLLVFDRDRGSVAGVGPPWQAGKALVDALRETEFENSPVFNVVEIDDRKSGEVALREHKAALLLEIPADFSTSLYSLTQGREEGAPAALHLVGAPES